MNALALACLLLTAAPSAPAASWAPKEGVELIGKAAPKWVGLTWLQGGPLSLEGLGGKVVLVRFWTSGCPYCAHTAPALEALQKKYGKRGLVVVAIHHPKSDGPREPENVRRAAKAIGLTVPIAIDNEWKTVRAYGVGSAFRSFTSVSVLIDQKGVIRFVHDGGEFHAGGEAGHEECAAAYETLEGVIEGLLKG